MFSCKFETDNAAFRDPYTGEKDEFTECAEIARILGKIQEKLAHGAASGSVMDLNGNKVGTWER